MELDVNADTRRVMDLGTFGFASKGQLKLLVRRFFVADPDLTKHNESVGFVLDPVHSAQAARVEKNNANADAADRRVCFIDDEVIRPQDPTQRLVFLLNTSDPESLVSKEFTATIEKADLYALFFFNCKGFKDVNQVVLKDDAISFEATVTMVNVDSRGNMNYLSVGDQALPTLYFLFALAFAVLAGLWIRMIRANRQHVHRIHNIMLVLVVLKALSLFFEALKFHHYSGSGTRSVWDVMYYITLTLKGVMLFAVLLLLGTGWSVLKAYLSEQDKKLLLALLTIQVLVNVCIAIIEETSEGNKYWSTWLDLFHVLDIICCCLNLLPIVWSIKNLRDTVGQDGKAALNLSRMRQLRTFYIIVVAYIYFTRIVVVMIEGATPYSVAWLPKVVREAAALAFYAFGGWQFRPANESSYLHLTEEDIVELESRNEIGEPQPPHTGSSPV